MIESYMGPTARFAGTNSERQMVGLPGHCVRCAEHGHVEAHPELGCGDVGCTAHHDEPTPERQPTTAEKGTPVVWWATLDLGVLTKRSSRADAEKWAALGRDRGRRVVAVLPVEDFDRCVLPPGGPDAQEDAPCTSCGVGNRQCFQEGGYCCNTCRDEGGMTHQTRPLPTGDGGNDE